MPHRQKREKRAGGAGVIAARFGAIALVAAPGRPVTCHEHQLGCAKNKPTACGSSVYRRLSKDYEFHPETSEVLIQAAMIHLLLRRLGTATKVARAA
jgi:hypothetical protein